MSEIETLHAVAVQYLQWDPCLETRQYISRLLEESASDESSLATPAASNLKVLLGSRLQFGTAGLRGPMQAGYNGMNYLVSYSYFLLFDCFHFLL